MLPFRDIELNDKKDIEYYTNKKKYYLCEHCFADLYIWRYFYSTQICIHDDFLYIKMKTNPENNTLYLAPIGTGDILSAIKNIEDDANERNITFSMISIPEQLKIELEYKCPNKFKYTEQRDNADYIYLSSDLIELKGKKFHSKRNFINRFKTEYKNQWFYEEINSENARDIFDYQIKWCEINECNDKKSFMGETCAISQALRNFKALDLKGGLIKLNNEIIAFSIGSKLYDEMFVVHIEKADYKIKGAYQMINQQFAEHNFKNIKYINREEDLGIEGLRKAKLSYNPVIISLNYSASCIN